MVGRVDVDPVGSLDPAPAERVDDDDAIDAVAEEVHSVGNLLVGGVYLNQVAAGAEGAALEVQVVAVVVDAHQMTQQSIASVLLAPRQPDDHAPPLLGIADGVDAGDGGDDDHVPAGEERGRGSQAEAVDLLVDVSVLLDIQVVLGDVRLWLIVIVVGDEVLDGVVREELSKFGVELSGQRLVVGQDQRRLLHLLDHLRYDVRLAGAGSTQQRLVLVSLADTLHQRCNGLRLVAGRLKVGDDLKPGHCYSACSGRTTVRRLLADPLHK